MTATDRDDKAEWRRLMIAAQDGDGASYRRLLEELQPVLRRVVARRWQGTAENAEDVVQEVLLSIHAVRHTYDPGRPLIPWLMAIVHHRIADAARRSGRRAAELAVDNIEETFGDVAAKSPSESQADGDALRRAVSDLPSGQRRAIEMLKLREMSLKEASATSGMSVAAIKVAVHRAVKRLRAVMRRGAD